MPLSHQAQRKTPATGAHVRPPWGSSGWNKSGAMVPDAKNPPPPVRSRSALSRREANVPRPSPAKPQPQPRASRARDKENPAGTSATTAPVAPAARTPPPVAAPFSDPGTTNAVASATSVPAPARPPTPVGSGGVGPAGTNFSLATSPSLERLPAPSPVSAERDGSNEDKEQEAVDACIKVLCTVETEGVEKALDESRSERVAVIDASSTPARGKKTVEIKIEAPSPAAEIVTPEKMLTRVGCAAPADGTADDAAISGPETPFTASRAAKRSRPDPNDVLQDGGEPAVDVEALSAPGGILHALFLSRSGGFSCESSDEEVVQRTEAVVFAKKLAEGAAAELASARFALRVTPEARVEKREALREVADRAADWLRALQPAFGAIADFATEAFETTRRAEARVEANKFSYLARAL